MNQESIDYFSKRVKELIDGIDKGDFSKDIIPDKYRWEHLLGLLLLKDSLDGGEDLFIQLYRKAIDSAKNYIRKKASSGQSIKVVFQSYSAAEWPAEEVYKRYQQTKGIETLVFVSPLMGRGKETAINSYSQTYDYFVQTGHRVYGGLDVETCKIKSWDDFGEAPDVLYQLSTWFTSLPEAQWFSRLPMRCLMAYIPYSLYLANNADGSYAVNSVYNKEIINLMWRVYCDTRFNLEGYKKYQLLKGENVRFSGYTKMDYFLDDKEMDAKEISNLWKIPVGNEEGKIKKIIIAPHYSVGNREIILYSTFKKNAWFWLYLAEKYKDKVSFVFKPHPNLRYVAVEEGLFKDYEEYDSYLQRWNDLPNAKVVQESSYLEYFVTSDAMIMDSISFLGEYLYVGKPLLFLTREEQRFLELGEKVVNAYYRVPGDDYSGIIDFIDDVVLSGNDFMKANREEVFDQEYNYVKQNGICASDFICKELLELIK